MLSRFRILFILVAIVCYQISDASEPVSDKIENLGRSLFFDSSLSMNRSMACATCHSPEQGFIDTRRNATASAVSLGDDGRSLGDRNTPTAGYAAYTPEFKRLENGVYRGGQFLDGRRNNLKEQAGDPLLNPIEMGMPDKQSVIARVKENPAYIKTFIEVFGKDVWQNTELAYGALTESIATFERTALFSPFDSRYDRYLRGEYQMSKMEDLGMTLFFSQQFTNCNICHQLKKTPHTEGETFANYEYHNIGVPVNQNARQLNGSKSDYVDQGLLNNPAVTDPKQAGKFKTPTLRNIAVTGPYMHNGVFQDLRTVVLFYNKYNSRSQKRQINPETNESWDAPEVTETLSLKELETGPALKDKEVDALVAFMKTLTDARYEHLLSAEPGAF